MPAPETITHDTPNKVVSCCGALSANGAPVRQGVAIPDPRGGGLGGGGLGLGGGGGLGLGGGGGLGLGGMVTVMVVV